MKILMVCLGNICRSPIAEGILRSKIESNGMDIVIDSAGTIDRHAGERPDARMRETAKSFGVNIDELRSRKIELHDFERFDQIYVMDASNYANVCALTNSETAKSKVKLILNELEPGKDLEVPDPYFGGEQGFIDVFHLLDAATDKIIEKIRVNGKR
jgi:protein-tyrosine phosphatase